MKTCPNCGATIGDSQRICPVCQVDYLQAAVAGITGQNDPNHASNNESDTELLLMSIEEGLRPLEQAKLPTIMDSFRRKALIINGIILALLLLSGVLTGGLIFYLAGAVVALFVLKGGIALMRGRQPLSSGEKIVRAVERVFEQDAAPLREQCADSAEVLERLDAMRQRISEAQAAMEEAHLRNNRWVIAISVTLLLLLSAGVGTLAIRNHQARKAEAAYAQQPEWVKLRDRYLAEGDDSEYAPHQPRMEVLRLMLRAEAYSEAELFFREHCQKKAGDGECALLIAREYREKGLQERLNAFAEGVSLRYDSDLKKIQQMKR